MSRVKNSAMAATRKVWRDPLPCRRLARWSATSVSSTRSMSVASYMPASLLSRAERFSRAGNGATWEYDDTAGKGARLATRGSVGLAVRRTARAGAAMAGALVSGSVRGSVERSSGVISTTESRFPASSAWGHRPEPSAQRSLDRRARDRFCSDDCQRLPAPGTQRNRLLRGVLSLVGVAFDHVVQEQLADGPVAVHVDGASVG